MCGRKQITVVKCWKRVKGDDVLNLKELREKNNLTQTALAKSLGVTSNAISAIEAGRLKLSAKLSDRIREVYGEVIEPEAKKARSVKKKTEKKAKTLRKKIENTAETAAAEGVLDAEKKVEKKTRKAKTKIQADKTAVEAGAEAVTEAAAEIEQKIGKKVRRAKKASVVIQSPMGGEITTDTILEKIGEADTIYVRVDQNKAYWVKGEETGSVDLW